MNGNEEAEKQLAEEEDIKQSLETDCAKLVMILSRLRECQRIQKRVEALENPQTSAGEALIKNDKN